MIMTAKERQRLERLEEENRRLRENHTKQLRIYSDLLVEVIELKAVLALVRSAVGTKEET